MTGLDLAQSQLLGLTPSTRFSRGLGAGFALAVPPAAATTITTDPKGLDARDVRIPVADGALPGFRAMPEAGGPFPTIIVVNEVFGVYAHVQAVCVRLAKLGYFATALELFAREGDVNTVTDLQTTLDTVSAKTPDSQVASDIDSIDRLGRNHEEGRYRAARDHRPLLGGGQVWLYAVRNPAKGGGSPGTASRSSAGRRRKCRHPGDPSTGPRTPPEGPRSMWSPTSRRRSSGFTAEPIPASRSLRSTACARRRRRLAKPRRSSSIPTPRTRSTRTIALPTGKAGEGWQRMLEWFER
jgi:carboxymethylenebutenolidase